MTDTKIIDGKAAAGELRAVLAGDITAFHKEYGMAPGLAVVLVGEDPASQVYVSHKLKACAEAGVKSFERRMPSDVSEAELLKEVAMLNANPQVHGILMQLPLPEHIDADKVIHAIDPAKDVDGFHPVNIGKLWLGEAALQPCTPTGCITLIKQVMPELSGKHAVILGRSNIVGKPMAALLLKESCTVSICHSRTTDLPAMVKQADIVVAAVGRANMVQGSWLKAGAVVIDVGINRLDSGEGKSKLVGDVDFDSCLGIASAITPVPGGVGPMTVAYLIQNTLHAARALSN